MSVGQPCESWPLRGRPAFHLQMPRRLYMRLRPASALSSRVELAETQQLSDRSDEANQNLVQQRLQTWQIPALSPVSQCSTL